MNKKGSLNGLGKVYKFSLHQLFKNKANIISFVVIIAVAIAAVPVMCLFMDPSSGETAVDFSSRIMTMDEFTSRDEVGFDARYAVQYGYSILVMIVCVFSCSYIVRAIVEEKSSKLVETLMVSVRSGALILGKILSVMTFIFAMVVAIFAAFGPSYFVTGMFMDTSVIGAKLEGMGITADMFSMGPGLIAIVIVSLLLAYMTFSQLAALSGAGCSNMEDVEAANMTAIIMILLGYMVSTIGTGFGSGPAIFLSLCPVVSAFSAPICFVLGDISLGILIGSWAIQIIFIAAINKVSSNVYDSLIMYKGNRLKMSKILAMAGDRRKEVK